MSIEFKISFPYGTHVLRCTQKSVANFLSLKGFETMSHKYLVFGFIIFTALESCGPKQKKKENPFQPTPTEVIVINEPVFKLSSAQEEQLKNIGKSNATDRCKSMARLDSPMDPHGFATEYTNEKGNKQKIQFQIKPSTDGDCLTNGNLVSFSLNSESKTGDNSDLSLTISTRLNFVPVESGYTPAVSFLTDCESKVQDGLIADRQKAGESLDYVQMQKILKIASEEICPQIKQQAANYVIDLLSK
jgi:hypothetical protein